MTGMRRFGIFLTFLLLLVAQQVQGQGIDTLRVQSREVPDALPKAREALTAPNIQLRMQVDKPWLEANDSMPSIFGKHEAAPASKQARYTLHPYNTTTPYDWDPVYNRKIAIHADTWRGTYWRMLGVSDVKGMTNSGHIKLPTDDEPLIRFENGMLVGDYATLLTQYFTREFWRFQHKRNQKKTKEVLQQYDKVESMP